MAWSFGDKMFSQGLGFLVGMILARLLMPEQYGVVALTSIFMAVSSVLVDAGFGTALVQKKDADDLDYCTVMYGSIGIGLVIYIILYIISPYAADFYHTPELTPILRVVALPFIWSGYNSVLNAYLYKRMQFRKFFYRNGIANVVSAIVGIWMAYAGYGAWALIGQSFTSNIVGMAILQYSVPWRPRLAFSLDRAKSLLRFGSSVAGASLIGTIFNELRGLLIGRFYAPRDLALFNKGGNFPRLIVGNIEGTFGAVLFPAMSQYGDDREKVKQMMRRSMRLGSYLMFFLLTTLIVICEPLIRVLYTDKWVGCVPYMQLICLQYMIDILTTENLQAYKAVGEGDTILKLEIYKKPVFLLMVIVAAYISVYALAVTLPVYALYAGVVNMRPNRKILNYSIREQFLDLAPASLLSLAAFCVAWPLSLLHLHDILMILIQTAACAIVYVALSWMFKVESLTYLKNMVRESCRKYLHKG